MLLFLLSPPTPPPAPPPPAVRSGIGLLAPAGAAGLEPKNQVATCAHGTGFFAIWASVGIPVYNEQYLSRRALNWHCFDFLCVNYRGLLGCAERGGGRSGNQNGTNLHDPP